MNVVPLPADERALRRYVERLWLPYHRELEATVESHALADGADLPDAEVAFRRDWLDAVDREAWVAVDGPVEGSDAVDAVVAAGDGGNLAGFVTAEVDRASPVFARPDRLLVGDLYVREPYRGSELARTLIGRVADRARETGCPEIALDVDVDNGRAAAFYAKMGFETHRRRLVADTGAL